MIISFHGDGKESSPIRARLEAAAAAASTTRARRCAYAVASKQAQRPTPPRSSAHRKLYRYLLQQVTAAARSFEKKERVFMTYLPPLIRRPCKRRRWGWKKHTPRPRCPCGARELIYWYNNIILYVSKPNERQWRAFARACVRVPACPCPRACLCVSCARALSPLEDPATRPINMTWRVRPSSGPPYQSA